MQYIYQNRKRTLGRAGRAGLTIMEVMFAIGVVLIGLLGLAGLIPVAIRYAGDTIRFDEAIQSGASASAMAKEEKIANFSRLRIALTPTMPPIIMTPHDLSDQVFLDSLDAPGYEELALRPGRFAGFCIDPVGVLAGPLSHPTSSYSTSVFPYYKTNWNPGKNPSDAWAPSETIGFPMPRLWRCQVLRNVGATPYDSATAESFFSLPGNPTRQSIKDRSLSAARLVSTSAGTPFTAASQNRFSWFATLTPGYDSSPTYILSTVIVDGRVPFITPAASISPAIRVEDNETSERIAWVTGMLGFTGGAGGDATIVGSSLVSNKVRAGQWVMLSRQDYKFFTSSTPPPPPPVPQNIPPQHSWYRIVSVSDATTDVTLPTGGTGWSRTLTLDGPDWDISGLSDMYVGTPYLQNDTICTIVQDAVEVIQTTVFLK